MSPLLTTRGLGLGTRLVDLSLTLEAGEAVAVVGPNGAGKSTLLRLCLGLEAPTSGSVRLGDAPLASLSHTQRAERVAWLPQHSRVREAISALEIVRAARYRFGESPAETTARARQSLDELAIGNLADRTMNRLSGGESQRVALAALHAQDAALLCLDEPANHLDPAVQLATWAVLGRWREADRGLLVVTHDLSLIRFLGPPERVSVLGLAQGRQQFLCRADDPDLPQSLSDLFGVAVRRVLVDGSPHLVVTA